MFYRQKLLLGLLQALGGRRNRTDFQKILFLLTRRQTKPAYDFIPYHYGCFSWQSYADLRALSARGFLVDGEEWRLAQDENHLATLTTPDRALVESLIAELDGLRGHDLVRKVYLKAPYYAIHSHIASEVLTASELEAVEKARPTESEATLFTIGYEGRSLDAFVDTLIRANVAVLCDVRKNAYSMKYGFSKAQLSKAVENSGIRYRHIPELGIASEKRKNLDSQNDYDVIFAEYERDTLPAQAAAVEEVIREVNDSGRVAIMCFEKDVCMCHRGRLALAVERHPGFTHSIAHL
jgi:hypothetical protein